MNPVLLDAGSATLETWRDVYRGGRTVTLSADAWAAVDASAAFVAELVASETVVYGVTTGFGRLADRVISKQDADELQRNLVLSHTVGVGEPLSDDVVRLVLALKAAALAHGVSGVRREVVQLLVSMLDRRVLPVVPSQGSVGASGDLAPLAHMASVMIGHGRASIDGTVLPGAEALRAVGLEPVTLRPKEGLALLNGTQTSCALALAALFEIDDLLRSALVVAALTVEAGLASTDPFQDRVQRLRPHPGQIQVAAILRRLLDDGGFRAAQPGAARAQDPYSLRCLPQVLGPAADLVSTAARTLEIEAAGASDNPLLFPDDGQVVSAGNFHAESVALAADLLAMVVAEIGGMSERRTAFLIDSSLSGLPAFLTDPSGLSSGFMPIQIAAAALVAENRQLAHPASVDNVPTAANQEDHVSMATHGARRLALMVRNATAVVAYELLAAVEGMDARGGLRSTAPLEAVRSLVRCAVPSMASDWEFSSAVETAVNLVAVGDITRAAGLTAPLWTWQNDTTNDDRETP
jgi:histidine ammonia-lyase